jgi:hypothetical protein
MCRIAAIGGRGRRGGIGAGFAVGKRRRCWPLLRLGGGGTVSLDVYLYYWVWSAWNSRVGKEGSRGYEGTLRHNRSSTTCCIELICCDLMDCSTFCETPSTTGGVNLSRLSCLNTRTGILDVFNPSTGRYKEICQTFLKGPLIRRCVAVVLLSVPIVSRSHHACGLEVKEQ